MVNNTSGVITTTQPFSSILHRLFEILNQGTKKIKLKFLQNLTSTLDFDPATTDIKVLSEHLTYVRFIAENLAFFEYTAIADVYRVVASMESIASSTGVAIQHFIETEIFAIGIETPGTEQQPVDPENLLLRATAAAILSIMWESRTHLRKLYNINEQKVRDFRRGKLPAKDLNKTPGKTPFFNGMTMVENVDMILTNFNTDEMMIQRCREARNSHAI